MPGDKIRNLLSDGAGLIIAGAALGKPQLIAAAGGGGGSPRCPAGDVILAGQFARQGHNGEPAGGALALAIPLRAGEVKVFADGGEDGAEVAVIAGEMFQKGAASVTVLLFRGRLEVVSKGAARGEFV